jgi:L-alanine-DL-glutamate epimerase-like enolase superfamily enzyme
MQIVAARAYRQWQPFRDGRYACSGGVADGFDSTIVALDAEDGTTGYGEARRRSRPVCARACPSCSRS